MRVENQYGVDLLQGLGNGRSPNQDTDTNIVIASTSLHPYVDPEDTLTLIVDNIGNPSSQFDIVLYYALGA